MSIIITGDVHGDFGTLNSMINKKRPEMVLCCGDFGYWPRSKGYTYNHYTNKGVVVKEKKPPSPKPSEKCNIFWCDGNHEDHQELDLRTTDELWARVHYMSRGSLLQLPDGRMVMFMGGALSVDKENRILGIDWFPQEVISDSDIRNLDYEGDVDIVISHTCPREFDVGLIGKDEGYYRDCSRMALSYVLHHYSPKLWYFGHWHTYKKGKYKDCEWTALSHTFEGSKWWEWLKI